MRRTWRTRHTASGPHAQVEGRGGSGVPCACYAFRTVDRYRILALLLALAGLALATYVEFGTPRAADVERSFGWLAYEAGPFLLVAVLAVLSPFGKSLCVVVALLLALEAYAYFSVFVRGIDADAALIYLHKPFYGLVIVATGVLAAFLVTHARQRHD